MRAETAVRHVFQGQVRSRHADKTIAALAGRQHGVVSRGQLRELGLGRGGVDHRIDRGRLHVIHRGVYAVGHSVLTARGRWMAAVLAAGPGAALSHRAAAAAWGVLGSTGPAIEVTVPRKARSRTGLLLRHRPLPADELTSIDRIPVTAVPRTLFDLAAVVPPHVLRHAIHEAEYLHLRDSLSLLDMLERYPAHRGVRALRAIVAMHAPGPAHTRSELEDRFLEFVQRRGLPSPEVNAVLELGGRAIEVGCLWRAERLIAELDGRDAHDSDPAFERDRKRDRALMVGGWRVTRITWRHLHHEPATLAAELRALLAAAAAPNRP
jgi:very-short-patch-repair endonuclease